MELTKPNGQFRFLQAEADYELTTQTVWLGQAALHNSTVWTHGENAAAFRAQENVLTANWTALEVKSALSVRGAINPWQVSHWPFI